MIKKEKTELPKQEMQKNAEPHAIKTEVEQLKEQLTDYTDQLKRLQAEFENYQKRVDKERKEFVCFANERMVCELLCILDDFEKALQSTQDEGIKMLYSKFKKIIEQHGVKQIMLTNGQRFDAFKHEVLCTEESDKHPEDTIISEIQKGYEMNGKIIRFTKVKIAKAKKSVGAKGTIKSVGGGQIK